MRLFLRLFLKINYYCTPKLLLFMKYILSFSLFMLSIFVHAQQKYTLSGTITDASNRENLLGANILVKEATTGTTTNEYGFYSITLPQGKYTIIIEYLGFESITTQIELTQNLRKDFSLQPQEVALASVEVSANASDYAQVRKPQMSVVSIPVATIKKMPVLIGEVDIVKSLLNLPGVSNAGEASSGFNVRGGGADQNLILLDEATIFNASHLFGFLSVFNADAVRDLKLYKGGIPARYGGRVSSVLDIYQKDGNLNHFSAQGGIGVLSSRLLAEGPIVKEKSSFLVAGRSSYAHLFLKLTDNKNSAYFYDLNTKLSFRLNPNNSLYLSGYFGRDFFNLNETLKNVYGNGLVNLRWNHLYNEKLFSNLSLIYSDYYYGFDFDYVGFEWKSSIKNFNLKYDFRHYLSQNTKLAYGLQSIYYTFAPGELTPSSGKSTIAPKILPKKYALEWALYAEAEQKISPKLNLSLGLRYSNFYHLGSQSVNLYANGEAVKYIATRKIYQKGNPIGQKHYKSGEIIDRFAQWEPRATLSYALTDNFSVKASYNRMAQYLHLISNTSSPTPLDVWAPSNQYMPPQMLNQYAVGMAANFNDRKYSLEVEAYFKNVKNRLEYIDGADLIANPAIEQVVLNSRNRAYGMEILLKKNTGKFTGWLAYTLSRSEQQTLGRTPEEPGINNGMWYKAPYDKPHDFSLSLNYDFSQKWSFSTVFSLQTGLPANFPVGKYDYFGLSIANYSERNAFRLPTYHRLDVAATYRVPQRHKRYKSEWSFGVYNLYNRKNAVSISFRENTDTGKNEAVRLSIFGIVPSVTYNFSF